MKLGAGWTGLILAPLLALSDQSVAYAFAGWSCAHQNVMVAHGVHAVFLIAILALVALDLPQAREGLRELRESAGFTTHRQDFIAVGAFVVGLFSAAIVVALWIPQWVLSPCSG